MSKVSAEGRLALFNRMQGRGDVFSIYIEDGAKLAALPKEMFAEIFYPLFQWWVNGTDVEPSDPRDKMVFNGLKTHQIENAVKRGVNLKNWLENAGKGGRPKGAKKPSGNQAETKRAQLEDTSDKTEDASRSLMSCTLVSSEGDNISRSGLAPSALVVTPDEVPSEEEAKRIIDENAPEVTSLPCMKSPTGKPNRLCLDFLNFEDDQERIEFICAELHEIEEMRDERHLATDEAKPLFKTFVMPIASLYADDDTLESRAKDAILTRALAKAYYVDRNGEDADEDAEFIINRVKEVAAAVKVLEAAKAKKPLSDSDY